MSKKANPILVGWFALGGLAIAITGLLIFGGSQLLEEEFPCITHFDESISGLDVGAPVDFKGVRVGTVTDIKIIVDRDKREIKRPVTFVMEPSRINFVGGDSSTITRDRLINSVENGLRVMLAKQSLLTGKLKLELYFDENKKQQDIMVSSNKLVEIPSVLSPMALATKEIASIDIPSIFEDIKVITTSLAEISTNNNIQQIVANANQTLNGLNDLVANVNKKVDPLGGNLLALTQSLQVAVTNLNTLVTDFDTRVPVMSSNLYSLASSAKDGVKNANKFIVELSSQLMPLMQEATTAVSNISEKVDSRSEFSLELTDLLESLNESMRSIGELADYLERHPETIMRGKK